MKSNKKSLGSEKNLGNATRTKDDVHQLRGIRLKGLKRDPGYFLGDRKVKPAHLEECFDADTLFYDIFFEPTNRYLVAVGPPLGNLQIALEVYVNGKPVKLSVIKRRRLQLVRGKVGRVKKLNDILIKANGQQWELSVPENDTGTKHKFTLCAIQKDNKEHWIKDWIEHYRKIGVDRVILYDNNSEKPPEVDAIVIPCPYKYGLDKYGSVYGSGGGWWQNNFLQRSLLTICGYKYRSGHLLNFDVDELLQVKSLEKYKKRKLIYFNSYFIETKADGKLPEDYSFRHFVYRNAQTRNRSYKYMVKMDALLSADTPHYARLKNPFPREIVLSLRKFWSYLKAKPPKKAMSKIALQEGEEVFYHYKGINTGWKEDRYSFDEATEVVKLEGSLP